MGTVKVTSAMKNWLEVIARGGRIKRLNSVTYLCCDKGGLTYTMVFKLLDAGLITFVDEIAILTDVGLMTVRL